MFIGETYSWDPTAFMENGWRDGIRTTKRMPSTDASPTSTRRTATLRRRRITMGIRSERALNFRR